LLCVAAAAALALSTSSNASATVLTFDDITNVVSEGFIPNGYGGVNWNKKGWIHKDRYNVSGYENGTVSGNYTAFNAFAAVGTVSDGLFDFNSAYLTAAWNNGLQVEVTGYLNATQLYQTTVAPSYSGPTLYNFNFQGINRLTFRSFGGTDANPNDDGAGEHFAMDNFSFGPAVATPEPASLTLLGLGVLGLAGYARRQRKAAAAA